MTSFFLSEKFLLGIEFENRTEGERAMTCLPKLPWEGYKTREDESTNLFCKSPGIKYFRLCGIYHFCYNYSILPLKHESRQYTNEYVWLCSNKTFFTVSGGRRICPTGSSLLTPPLGRACMRSYSTWQVRIIHYWRTEIVREVVSGCSQTVGAVDRCQQFCCNLAKRHSGSAEE